MTEVVPHQLRDKAYSVFLNTTWLCVLATSLGTLEGACFLHIAGCSLSKILCCIVSIAIDGLGGMHHNMTDEDRNTAQKHGVALLYFILFGVSCAGLLFVYVMVPSDKSFYEPLLSRADDHLDNKS
jgi:hypothetical protein